MNPKQASFERTIKIDVGGICMRALPLVPGAWLEFWTIVEAARLRLPQEAPEFLCFDMAATRFASFGVPWWCAYSCRSRKASA